MCPGCVPKSTPANRPPGRADHHEKAALPGPTIRANEPHCLPRRPFRFFFVSREEERLHIHVESADGEAKFWVEPKIDLARNYGLSPQDLSRVEQLIEEREQEIRDARVAFAARRRTHWWALGALGDHDRYGRGHASQGLGVPDHAPGKIAELDPA